MSFIDLSKIYHQYSKHSARGHLPISNDHNEWPEDWKIQHYKIYPRLPKINLPKVKPRADFFHLIEKRQSRRKFRKSPVSLRELATLLKYSCGITRTGPDGRAYRAQPSGGACSPIEVYAAVLVPGVGLPAGLYHYAVKGNQLDVLWRHQFTAEETRGFSGYAWVQDASIVLVMTAVFNRNQIKYGERGYRYMVIEAGHIGQNIYLIAEALGIQCCSLGGTQDANIDALLDIDGFTESMLYALALGK